MPYIFRVCDTDYTELRERDGQEIEIVRTITEPEEGFDAEVLPMHRIRFADGYESDAFTDEVERLWEPIPGASTVEYRDTL